MSAGELVRLYFGLGLDEAQLPTVLELTPKTSHTFMRRPARPFVFRGFGIEGEDLARVVLERFQIANIAFLDLAVRASDLKDHALPLLPPVWRVGVSENIRIDLRVVGPDPAIVRAWIEGDYTE